MKLHEAQKLIEKSKEPSGTDGYRVGYEIKVSGGWASRNVPDNDEPGFKSLNEALIFQTDFYQAVKNDDNYCNIYLKEAKTFMPLQDQPIYKKGYPSSQLKRKLGLTSK